jgi:D-arabinose 1-dehydrogenase-like Zn-dependent alcohol dehydrogenase
MGTREELEQLLAFLELSAVRPRIARRLELREAREGMAALIDGDVLGKIVLCP